MPAAGAGSYGEDNPFIEAMLRMMEVFGLIDRSRLPLGIPYMPSYSSSMVPGLGGFPGMSGYPGMGTMPGISPMYGMRGLPGVGGMPGGWGNSGWAGQQGDAARSGYLDGIWDLTNGSLVVVKRAAARLYVSPDRYQDFILGYDQQRLWWTPRGGNTTTTYLYQMRDGRMVLRDNKGKVLLMRRRS